MRFAASDDDASLAAAVAEAAAAGAGVDRWWTDGTPRASAPRDAWWAQTSQELGLAGLAVPRTFGGQGRFTALVAVMRETGRALSQVPLLSSAVLATHAVLFAAEGALTEPLLRGLAEGRATGSLAVAEGERGWDIDSTETLAHFVGGEYEISGRKSFVLDGGTADVWIVTARTQAGVSLFLVDSAAPGVTVADEPPLDPTRPFATITFDRAVGRLIGDEGEAPRVLEQVLHVALTALAAEQLGGAEACLDLTVEHVRTREQGGRPIGSRQTVRNACVEMLGDVETARSAVHYAAWAVHEHAADVATAALVAGQHCSDSFVRCANSAVQLHGGHGFQMSTAPHRYLRRALSSSRLLLNADDQRERFVQHLLQAGGLAIAADA